MASKRVPPHLQPCEISAEATFSLISAIAVSTLCQTYAFFSTSQESALCNLLVQHCLLMKDPLQEFWVPWYFANSLKLF